MIRKFLLLTVSVTAYFFISTLQVEGAVWYTDIKSWFRYNEKPWVANGTKNANFSHDGKYVALSCTNKTVTIKRIKDQKIVKIFDFSFIEGGSLSLPGSITYSKNMRYLAVAFEKDKKIIIIDQKKEKIAYRINIKFNPRNIRFSPRSRFLLIGNKYNKDSYMAIYDLYHNRFFYEKPYSIIGDFSREDRYFYFYKKNRGIIWIDAVTKQKLKRIPINKLSLGNDILSLRVLRDHQIAIGFKHSLHLMDRFLTKIKKSYYFQSGLIVNMIKPSSDKKFLLLGSSDKQIMLQLHHNKRYKLDIPQTVNNVAIYPSGHSYLYSDHKDKTTRIINFKTKNNSWH